MPKKVNIPKVVYSAILLLVPVIVLPQQEKTRQIYFENYTSEKGLSQNSCYAIEQDADGFMWFGTQDGLNRYDGKEFKVYLLQSTANQNQLSNTISSLFFDKQKKMLWVGTIRGICLYDPQKDIILNITDIYPFAEALKEVDVKKITAFDEDIYWIVTYSKGLILVDTKQKKLYSYFNDENNRKMVTGIVKHQDKIIVSLLHELKLFTPNGESYTQYPLLTNKRLPEIKELFAYEQDLWIGTLMSGCIKVNNVFSDQPQLTLIDPDVGGIGSFVADALGNLWMGTRGKGVLIYRLSDGQITYSFNNPFNNRSLGRNFALSLFKDRQNIIWVGLSGGGVAKYDLLSQQFYTYSHIPENSLSLPDNMVFTIHGSTNGKFYIGTQNKGLVEWNPQTDQFYTYTSSSSFGATNNTIYDITEEDDNHLWIAGWSGLMQLNTQTKQLTYHDEQQLLTAKKLYAVHKLNKKDSLFIAGENGMTFYSLKEKKWKPLEDRNSVKKADGRHIFEDDNGVLWICTIGEGLIKYDYQHNDFRIVEAVKKYSFYVRHLQSKNDHLWLATDNGVLLYNPKKDSVEKYINLSLVAKSGVCYAIVEDDEGYMWVSSNNGLFKIHPTTFQIVNYDLGNGLDFLEFNTACAVKEKNGAVLFGGVGGITKFQPSNLYENIFSPLPLITSLYVKDTVWKNHLSISQTKKVNFSYRQNFITIYFAVNNFSSSGKNSYAYRLLGLSKDWTNSGNRNFVSYTALSPGSYTFQLKSANSDGKWSNGITELAITIHPPWWQTWWFRGLVVLSLAALITFLVRRRIAFIRKEAEFKHRIAETEMAALRVQMNPHFIFNSLNSINSFIVENKTHLASDYLTKFSRLIRLILDNSKNESITLEKELETLKLYLLMERLRFENKFDYQVAVDGDIDEQLVKVPPMIIQPYAENAIWHGLLHQQSKGKLNVQVRRVNGAIQFTVEDNGIGRQKSAQLKSRNHNTRKSYGLQITQERLQRLNDKNSIDIIDLENGEGETTGTRVIITLYNSEN